MHRWLLFAALLTAVVAFASVGRGRRTLSWVGTLLTAGLVVASLYWRTAPSQPATDPITAIDNDLWEPYRERRKTNGSRPLPPAVNATNRSTTVGTPRIIVR